jgi:3-oxoacyl-[acyl-carrier protein] reductase
LSAILKNKKILITGASRGLGEVIARALADQEAILVLMARSKNKLQEIKDSLKHPEKHSIIVVDLTDTKALHQAVDQAVKFLEVVDVVLHVAGGGLGLRDPLLSSEELFRLFNINIGAAVEINKIIVPQMIQRKSGNLVHVCSIASSEASGSVGYNTVKAALAAYVRTLGRELAGSDIVATGILPGGFYAPRNSWERLKEKNPAVVKQFIEERLPRGFLGLGEELIPMIQLLCSDDASMMAGCLVPIDAGEGKTYQI